MRSTDVQARKECLTDRDRSAVLRLQRATTICENCAPVSPCWRCSSVADRAPNVAPERRPSHRSRRDRTAGRRLVLPHACRSVRSARLPNRSVTVVGDGCLRGGERRRVRSTCVGDDGPRSKLEPVGTAGPSWLVRAVPGLILGGALGGDGGGDAVGGAQRRERSGLQAGVDRTVRCPVGVLDTDSAAGGRRADHDVGVGAARRGFGCVGGQACHPPARRSGSARPLRTEATAGDRRARSRSRC